MRKTGMMNVTEVATSFAQRGASVEITGSGLQVDVAGMRQTVSCQDGQVSRRAVYGAMRAAGFPAPAFR